MTVHQLPGRRPAPRSTRQQQVDEAIGIALLILGFGAGVLLLCWLVSLPFRHLYS